MNIARWIVLLAGLFFLLVGMLFLWGTPKMPTVWLNGYLVGAIFTTYAIPTLWIGVTGTYRVLAGAALAGLITFGASAIYFLRLSLNSPIFLQVGEYTLSLAVLSLWFLFFGWRMPKHKHDRIPFTTQLLFALMLTVLLMRGVFLVIPVPGFFPWAITPELSVLFGWFLIGAAVFFGWTLFQPIWENAYPLLYGLVTYAALMIGPYTSLLKEPTLVAVVPTQLWVSLLIIGVGGLWALLELIARFFTVRRR